MDGGNTASSPVSPPSPLHLDVQHQAKLLLTDLHTPAHSSATITPNIIFETANSDQPVSSELLDALSLLAALDGVSQHVFIRFEPIALDLLARWLDPQIITEEQWELRLSSVAALASLRPDLWAVINAIITSSPFNKFPLALLHPDQILETLPTRLHRLLLAYWRLLAADDRIAARNDWPSIPLHRLRKAHPDLGVRLLAIHCLAKQKKWSEEKRRKALRTAVGTESVDVIVEFGFELASSSSGGFEVRARTVDGWLLPLLEAKRIEEYRRSLRQEPPSFRSHLTISPEQLSRNTVAIGQSLLLRVLRGAPIPPSIHVDTLSSTTALQQLVPLLQRGLPILLSSPPSSGKTHLLQHLSSTIYPDVYPTTRMLTIPLADTSIDVKSLIGTYVSSRSQPGSFEWMEGALAKAVRAGRWVVFDDIDRASTEMLMTINGLARSLQPGLPGRRAMLQVSGREDIVAGDGFAMFATRSLRVGSYSPATFFGHQKFREVFLDAPTLDDVRAILLANHGESMTLVAPVLLDIWQKLQSLPGGSHSKARDIGLRDLEKWCARLQKHLPPVTEASTTINPLANPAIQQAAFLEAADILVAALDSRPSSAELQHQMMMIVADGLRLEEETAISLLSTRRPTLEVATSSRQLFIGRTSLKIHGSDRKRKTMTRPFALTRPSLNLLERIAVAVNMAEPLLLVGETGTGKTTAVQHISTICNKPLTVLNLSMQTESSDLLGGFKPIDAMAAARSLHTAWQRLFTETFSTAKSENAKYLDLALKALSGRKWERCVGLWRNSSERAVARLLKRHEAINGDNDGSASKKRKVNGQASGAKAAEDLQRRWESLRAEVEDFELQHVKMHSKLVFTFIEGPLVKALQNGEWILLDEVNLASQETLEAIATILEGSHSSLVLTERGDVEPITRHPDFRLFACMNPATDVGKKDLPPNLRSRFTELYVPPPDDDREALVAIVSQYIGEAVAGDMSVVMDITEMYSTLKRLSAAKEIVDGSNIAPHYSMRTLARALTFAVETAPLFGLRRGLWEGCLMAFTMSLDLESTQRAQKVCEQHILGPMKNARAVLAQIPSIPSSADPDDFVRFGPFWLKRGPGAPVSESKYIITPSVQAKLADLARVIMTHKYPVLIQGPTSSGKTSAVEFLARQTGHRFVRINNHEHTDIQEYLGTYVTDPQTGNLTFQEGLLVTAVREGHWIVLDELNLAPTDVLEALNRLLDDNRELVLPETQEIIKPHPNFILFATQNPPGLYAGRKILSRAFRNRFLEVHFDDVPKNELEIILCQRCQIAPSYAKKIVQVFEELRHRRQASRVFESKSSFATLRDLFRWADRGAVGYQQLAEDGYMLLAERGRQEEDKAVIKEVIESIMKVTVDPARLYELFEQPATSILSRLPFSAVPASSLVWTKAMQRLFALIAFALAHDEPVLLVGETGCGKTSVCEIIARAFSQAMIGVNCHQNMETADLLGSQRPVRNRHERKAKILAALSPFATLPADADEDAIASTLSELSHRTDVDHSIVQSLSRELPQLSALFEWSDGPLVHAMQAGDLLLLDEVSLADDSVLERLNSVLEPGRTLVLAEKGGNDIDAVTLVANPRFHVVATMNPGGDFGKKELSPALRNRFTEIWVPPLNDRHDLLQIIELSWQHEALEKCGEPLLAFFDWFRERIGDASGLGLRDILAWVQFMNEIFGRSHLDIGQAFLHGGQMVLVDGLESLPQIAGLPAASVATLREECLSRLRASATDFGVSDGRNPPISFEVTPDEVRIGGYGIPRGTFTSQSSHFRFETPTTALNAMRVLRGCQLPKAILLEGSPGVGKTSLVSALATVAGHKLQRINLSDQTDLIDLFGSDLPVEGGQAGEFQWRDAAFLDALQRGDWVLLDEMNLASQTVLEGLNAVLDHRGTVFIPELGRSFVRHENFRVFAAQNPLQQGGGRKGLPKSFLNRFTKVYLQEHTPDDLFLICREVHTASDDMVRKMISFNEIIREKTMVTKTIGRQGSPWEFNLRDLFRWFSLMSRPNGLELSDHPLEFLRMVYLQRFRNAADREAVASIFEETFGIKLDLTRPAPFSTPTHFQIGHSAVTRLGPISPVTQLAKGHLEVAESVLRSVEMGWMVILAGETAAGKRELVQAIASSAGRDLGELAMHPGVDTSELLGSFEQQDASRALSSFLGEVDLLVDVAADADHDISPSVVAIRVAAKGLAAAATDEGRSSLLSSIRDQLLGLKDLVDISSAVNAWQHLAATGSHATGFVWVDGALLTALRTGGWFLISEANLCSASVLDRLNSLCETNGVLVLSEKGSSTGSPEVITPHPDFRLFMTYDPAHGELSRAMRNRGVELYVDPLSSNPEVRSDPSVLQDDTLLRSYELYHSVSRATPAGIANAVASQASSGSDLLPRFGLSTGETHDLYQMAIPLGLSARFLAEGLPLVNQALIRLDPSLDPHSGQVTSPQLYRLILIFLRNVAAQRQRDAWLVEEGHGKSILALSAQAMRRGNNRVKPFPGQAVFQLVDSLRAGLSAYVRTLPFGPTTSLERLHVAVTLLEKYAQSPTFDYSATQILAKAIQDTLAQVPVTLPSSTGLIELAQSVELTQGLGQSAIWAVFSTGIHKASGALRDLANKLNQITDISIRHDVVAILARVDESNSEGIEGELRLLLDDMPKNALSPRADEADRFEDVSAPLRLILEKSMLAHSEPSGAFNLLLQERTLTLDTMSAIRRSQADQTSPGSVLRSITHLLQRLWTTDDIGPDSLFAPALLKATLELGADQAVSLADLEAEQKAAKFVTGTVIWSLHASTGRREDALSIAQAVLTALGAAFGARVLPSLSFESSQNDLGMDNDDSIFAKAVHSHLGGLLKQTDAANGLTYVGNVYLGIGRLLLDLFVTNIPIDPVVERQLKLDGVALQLTDLKEELDAITAAETAIKGISHSHRARDIAERIEHMQAEHTELSGGIARKPDATRLAALFSEIYSFLTDAMDGAAVDDLVKALRAGQPQALQREQSFQLAAASVLRRLQASYEDLSDLTSPIITALLLVRFGLRCHARDIQIKQASAQSVVQAALTFPIVDAAQRVCALTASSTKVSHQLLSAASTVFELDLLGSDAATALSVARQLSRVYQTWSAIRTKELQAEQASESLYRVKKTDIDVLSDLEQEEKEFGEMFPTYDQEESPSGQVTNGISDDHASNDSQKFSPQNVLAFHQIVMSTFGTGSADTPESLLRLAKDEVLNRFDFVAFDESVDKLSAAIQVRRLCDRLRNSTSNSPGNFYLSPNQPEVRKVYPIVSALVARLKDLIVEWPEQMVLQHILERAERFMGLSISSPVAQVLASLEQLLQHTDDWETYANRDNSLQAFRDRVTGLIIEWRRLELASWVRLLDDQAKQYIDSDAEWTLRLYGALLEGVLAHDDLNKHLESTIPLINTFLGTSSLGHFGPRLEVLKAFERMANSLAGVDDVGPRLERVATLLHNIVANAVLYLPRIKDSLQTQRAALDKNIRDFVKLASWKDVNVYALRASAQKTHRQLHRAIRKFRDILRQPVSPLLADMTSFSAQENPVASAFTAAPIAVSAPELDEQYLLQRPTGAVVPEPLKNVAVTYQRFRAVHQAFGEAQRSQAPEDIDTFAVDIIETAAMLAKATPSILTKENAKLVKNLATRKRKAFADLLSALRETGFSSSVRADLLAKQNSNQWILERLALPVHLGEQATKKIESYHHRLAVIMATLRAAFNGHNDDIASQDLQRGIGFTESVYAVALTERDRAAGWLSALVKTSYRLERLSACAASTATYGGPPVLAAFEATLRRLCEIQNAMQEAETGIRDLRELQARSPADADLGLVQRLKQRTAGDTAALRTACAAAQASGCSLFTNEEYGALTQAKTTFEHVQQELRQQAHQMPELRHLLIPIADMAVVPPESNLSGTSSDGATEAVMEKSDNLIQKLLVVTQRLDTVPPAALDDDTRLRLTDDLSSQRKLYDSLRLADILQTLDEVLSLASQSATAAGSPDFSKSLAGLVPFLQVFTDTLSHRIATHLHTVQSTYKLCYVVARVMLDLATKGFCKPQEASDDAEGDGGETVEGTGMGAGTGDKNVSSEIQEESQVEGLQGEQEEDGEQKADGEKEGEDDAVSMDEDFEGALEDGKEKEEGGNDDDEEGEEEDHDEHAGDVDPLDPGAVDEKFWGEEKDETKKDGDDKMNEQQQTQEQEGESEMTAKENDQKGKDKKEKKEGTDNAAGEQESALEAEGEGVEDLPEPQEDAGHGDEDEGEQQQQQKPDEVAAPEGENLDLPEDLDLGENDAADDMDGIDDDDLSLPADEAEGSDDDMNADGERALDDEMEGEATEDAPDAAGVGEDDAMEQEETLNQNVDLSASNDAFAQESQDFSKGQSGSTQQQQKEAAENEAPETKPDEEEAKEPQGDGVAPQAAAGGATTEQQDQQDGPTDSAGAPMPAETSAQQDNRSLGDILKDIRRRRDEILAQQERAEQSADAPNEAPGQVEYLREDQSAEDETQALGAAGEDERQKLEDLNIVDDEQENEDQAMPMEDDVEGDGDEARRPPASHPERAAPPERGLDESISAEKALTQTDIRGNAEPAQTELGEDFDLERGDMAHETTAEIVDPQGPEQIKLEIVDPSSQAMVQTGEDTWRQYASLTSELSYALCEQLRLILEPTLATRLQGDFRTGKRLNMRKIIPYIASEYTKDKIWLRRTKPSRREYQVLLSLDDSRSMSESHSVHLAYQTLALVCQALNKLEVGQVAVAKFGDGVDILHPFGEGGFTDRDGAKVVQSFGFDQQRTDVARLVEKTLEYLAQARQSQSATQTSADLWQLQIIISDGVCQDHHKLRTLLRRAVEERVMVVFIIVDSLHQQPSASSQSAPSTGSAAARPSILSMQSVEYTNVNGSMELEMKRYLDTFPFEFYVVLRDVEALPGVLADTLRQWMARVSQSQE